jgi:2',3'-cyclic-nucleotide 2'-phosphodiesterase (5'-nucleotidase family)
VKKGFGNDRTVIVNAGNNFDTAAQDDDLAPDYIIKALGLSRTEVIAPGLSEIAFSMDKVRKMAADASVYVVSANINGVLPYVVLPKNRGRTKVLVTSVIDPALLKKNHGISKDFVRDPVTALKDISRQISHDLFVVVIHGDAEMIASVTRYCPEIDVVIDGMSSESEVSPARETASGPPVVANNTESMYVAYMDYAENKGGLPCFSSPERLRADVETVSEDPRISALIQEYNVKREELLQRRSGAAGESPPLFEAGSHYAGSESCNLCHADIADAWAASRHAEAMDSLTRKSRQNDPECLSCHVTGMENRASAGFVQVSKDHPMAGVQCEACHGPGADHLRNPEKFNMQSVTENTCTRCHTQFKDPEFDFSRDLFKVNHGRVKVGLKGR